MFRDFQKLYLDIFKSLVALCQTINNQLIVFLVTIYEKSVNDNILEYGMDKSQTIAISFSSVDSTLFDAGHADSIRNRSKQAQLELTE